MSQEMTPGARQRAQQEIRDAAAAEIARLRRETDSASTPGQRQRAETRLRRAAAREIAMLRRGEK